MDFIILWVLIGEGHFEKAGKYTDMASCTSEMTIQSVTQESKGNSHYAYACVRDGADWPRVIDRSWEGSSYEEEHRS